MYEPLPPWMMRADRAARVVVISAPSRGDAPRREAIMRRYRDDAARYVRALEAVVASRLLQEEPDAGG